MKNLQRVSFAIVASLILGIAAAATFNEFTPATGILKGNANSPDTTAATSADVIATWSGVCSSSTYLNGAGTCAAVSLTAHVTGTLPVANGGTNLTSSADDNVMVGNGTTWQSKALTDCDAASSAVTYDVTANVWGCNTIAGATFANPTASVGLSAVNGVATTAMRSDGAPALSQAITPTWTNVHTFSGAAGADAVTVSGTSPNIRIFDSNEASDQKNTRILGNDSQYRIAFINDALSAATVPYEINRSADSATTHIWRTATTARMTLGPGLQLGAPTGGDQGSGTLNATGLFVNGVSVSGGATQTGTFNPTFTGFSSAPTCTVKWRLTGSQVSFFVNAGGSCTGTSNATTMTITNLPGTITPSVNATVTSACTDNSNEIVCSGTFTSSGTVVFSATSLGGLGTSNWSGAGTKGFTTAVFIYDLRN